jgi:WD40 repeat protein
MLYATAVMGIVLLSCSVPGQGQGSVKPVATASPLGVKIPASAGYFYSLAWLRDGTLVVGTGPDATPSIEQLWQFHQDGSEVRQLPTPSDSSCRLATRYMFPIALPDGRLGLTKKCDTANPGVERFASAVAYDLRSQSFSALADVGARMAGVGGVSWNPDLTRGIGAQSSRICSDVAWVTPNGPEGIAAEIRQGGKSWRLDGWLSQPAGASCTNQGRADCPAWSPDGRQIALLASPESIGVDGQARLDVPWSIYLIDVGSLHASKVLGNLQDACDLAWSPDGRWLAFTGKVSDQRGIWLFSPSTTKLHLVASHGNDPRNPVWSPDSRKVVFDETLSPSGQWPPTTRLAIADVSVVTARA